MRVTKVAFILVVYLIISLIGGFVGMVSTPDYAHADGAGTSPPITDTIPADTSGDFNTYLFDKTQDVTQVDLYWDLLTLTLTVPI